MTRFITKNKLKKTGASLAAAVFWLAVWQLASVKVAQELLLVPPARAFLRLFELAGQPRFWQPVLFSCLRVVGGFVLALILGVVLAVIAARSSPVRHLLEPLFGIIRATPVVSFIILVVLWMPSSSVPVFIAFLMVIPMVWANLRTGIGETDPDLLEMARVFRFSRMKTVRMVYIPSVLPQLVSACRVGIGFAWKSVIAAEVICLPRAAIGKQIYNARIYTETADLFAWTIAVILLSVLIERLAVHMFDAFSGRRGLR